MDNTGIQAADGRFADFNDLCAGIQQNRDKIFFLFTRKFTFYQCGYIDGIFDNLPVIRRRISFQTVCQFKSGFDLAGLSQPDTFNLRKLLHSGLCQTFQSIKLTKQSLRCKFDGLKGLAQATVEELSEIKGIGLAKSCQIKAAFELANRLEGYPPADNRQIIKNPVDVAALVKNKLTVKRKNILSLFCWIPAHRSLKSAKRPRQPGYQCCPPQRSI